MLTVLTKLSEQTARAVGLPCSLTSPSARLCLLPSFSVSMQREVLTDAPNTNLRPKFASGRTQPATLTFYLRENT